MVNFFCSNLFFFSRKYSKTVTSAHRHKMTETKATSMATITLLLSFSKNNFPMRYISESLEINVLISRNDVLFKDIKISLGLLITAKKYPVLFRESHNTDLSTTANNRIMRYAFFSSRPKFRQNFNA